MSKKHLVDSMGVLTADGETEKFSTYLGATPEQQASLRAGTSRLVVMNEGVEIVDVPTDPVLDYARAQGVSYGDAAETFFEG